MAEPYRGLVAAIPQALAGADFADSYEMLPSFRHGSYIIASDYLRKARERDLRIAADGF